VCSGAGHGGDDGDGDQTKESGDSPRCVTLKIDNDDVKMIQSDRLGASIRMEVEICSVEGQHSGHKLREGQEDVCA
jgi:hypothetical protein